MKSVKKMLLWATLLCMLPAFAQTEHRLTIKVTSEVPGESLEGQAFSLRHMEYGLDYDRTVLNTDGEWTGQVFEGINRLILEKDGYEPVERDINVTADLVEEVQLKELRQAPYALKTETHHNALTGQNDVTLTWNIEDPVFFDDFESYEDFSINESGNEWNGWSGFDLDQETTGKIDSDYPNQMKLQYAMVINPMEAGEPLWWYKFPQMRPYEGLKYMGFFRLQSGNQNNDWLVSPAITVKKNNILQFMAKAGHEAAERFLVHITEQVENTRPEDFIRLTPGNYETADSWETWRAVQYDLADYEGKTVKIAIQYIGWPNNYGGMMLMVDNFYVGQPIYEEPAAVKRVSSRSAANPNESFKLYLDDEEVGTTEAYSYRFENLSEGEHTLAVKAVYKSGVESETTSIPVSVSNADCYKLTVNVSTDNESPADGKKVELLNMETAETLSQTVTEGKVAWLSLPKGTYTLSMDDSLFEPWQQEIVMESENAIDITLNERRFTPYNITADLTETESGTFDALIKWNQDLGFYDSFEDYDDFAQESFGDWISIDVDGMTVYSVGLGSTSNIVTFPGASTPDNPMPIAPIVFNPSATRPAMAPTDASAIAPEGDKYIAFFSAAGGASDKWLISPLQSIREGYICQIVAKAYSAYPESMELCVSTSGTNPADFTSIGKIELTTKWKYNVADLKDYVGQDVYVAIHYTSYDAFLAQVDNFYIGPADDVSAEVGAVLHYEVSLDGGEAQTFTEPVANFTGLAQGEHTVAITSVYKTGKSETATYTFVAEKEPSGITNPSADNTTVASRNGAIQVWTSEPEIVLYGIDGQLMEVRKTEAGTATFNVAPGVYLIKAGNGTYKTAVH